MQEKEIGWEIIKDLNANKFFILGKSYDALRVSLIVKELLEKGFRVQDVTPLLKTFPDEQSLIQYFKSINYEYCNEDYKTYFGI
ncbi:hypothetical protein J6O48_14250 [bacterium]|nr:hypothetical protein [bacterium]